MEIKLGIAKIIDDSIINTHKKERKRDYLGASIIGDPCERKIWYMFNMPKDIDDPRLLRIFKLGQVIEDYIVVPMLKDAGFKVFEKDENGEQFGFKDGKLAGHCDGVIVGLPESKVPHLLEIKSANNNRFKQFERDGYAATSSTYYAQVQVYMHFLKLTRALVVVYNKDTSALYFERIKYDSMYAELVIEKAHRIIDSKEMPDRAFKRSTDFRCRFCQYKKECWEEK